MTWTKRVDGELRMALDRARASSWIPVTQRLPELYDDVLVAIAGIERPTVAWRQKDGTWSDRVLPNMSQVTHWMPLPALPEDDKEKGTL